MSAKERDKERERRREGGGWKEERESGEREGEWGAERAQKFAEAPFSFSHDRSSFHLLQTKPGFYFYFITKSL